MFYIIIMVIAIVLIIPIKKRKDTPFSKMCFSISFLVSLLPSALRYGIGTDYFYTYVPYFRWIGNGQKEFGEVGFNLINKLIYNCTEDYRVLFFVTSFIILFLIYKSIWENSENIFQSILLIFIGQFYFYSMNLVRQAIAMSIIVYSFKYIKEKNILKTIISILIATLFHNSALIMIPILLISFMNISNIKKILIGGSILLIQPLMLKLIIWIMGFTKYIWYYEQGLFTEQISILLLIQNIMIFVIDIYYQKVYKEKINDEYKILSNINFIGLCLMVLSSNIPLVFRMVRYCTVFQILLIPKIIGLSDNKTNKSILSVIIYGFMFISMVYQIMICGGEGVYPYNSIFGTILK